MPVFNEAEFPTVELDPLREIHEVDNYGLRGEKGDTGDRGEEGEPGEYVTDPGDIDASAKVVHGSISDTARPIGAQKTYWEGRAIPTQARIGDTWYGLDNEFHVLEESGWTDPPLLAEAVGFWTAQDYDAGEDDFLDLTLNDRPAVNNGCQVLGPNDGPSIWVPGIAGNGLTAPDASDLIWAASVSMVIDFSEITISGNLQYLGGHKSGANPAAGMLVFRHPSNTQGLRVLVGDGTTSIDTDYQSTPAVAFGSSGRLRITATIAGVVTCETWDGDSWELDWTYNGAALTGPIDATSGVAVGRIPYSFSGSVLNARVNEVEWWVDGVRVRHMDPADCPNTELQPTTFVSSTTGETWTINRSATGYKTTFVPADRRVVVGDGVDDWLVVAHHADFNLGAGDSATLLSVVRLWHPANTARLMGKRSSSLAGSELSVVSGSARMLWEDDSGANFFDDDAAITPGQLVVIAGVLDRDTGTLRTFVEGANAGSMNIAAMGAVTSSAALGILRSGTAANFAAAEWVGSAFFKGTDGAGILSGPEQLALKAEIVDALDSPEVTLSIPTINSFNTLDSEQYLTEDEAGIWKINEPAEDGSFVRIAHDEEFPVGTTFKFNNAGEAPLSIKIEGQEAGPISGGTETLLSTGAEVCDFTEDGTLTVDEDTTVRVLVVAGGGSGGTVSNSGGGARSGGGGGAGGVIEDEITLEPGTYPVVVGAGGPARDGLSSQNGANGANSTLHTLTAIGGGGGAEIASPAASGGSGGGGFASNSAPTTRPGGSGTIGQGYAGGSGVDGNSTTRAAGGGGGAGGVGEDGSTAGSGHGGAGGPGLGSDITGLAQHYGGGGGGYGKSVFGPGGIGGGGRSQGQGNPATSGTSGTGGGGGGAQSVGDPTGAGGSGRVIVRWDSPPQIILEEDWESAQLIKKAEGEWILIS